MAAKLQPVGQYWREATASCEHLATSLCVLMCIAEPMQQPTLVPARALRPVKAGNNRTVFEGEVRGTCLLVLFWSAATSNHLKPPHLVHCRCGGGGGGGACSGSSVPAQACQ